MAELEGEDKPLAELKKGGGGGGKEGETGESRLEVLVKGGRVTLLNGLLEGRGDMGEETLEVEELEDWVT